MAKISTQMAVMPIAHFASGVKLKIGSTSNRMLANTQAAEGWDNLAYCLKTQDRLKEAIECHQRAVALKPDFAAGWYNYGLTLSLYGHIADALACHERALVADPQYAKGHYGRAQALQQSHRIDEALAAYATYLEAEPGHHEARSYRLFALNNVDHLSREAIFAEHQAFGRAIPTHPVPDFPNQPVVGRKLRVALFSPDLRAHSCAFFIEPLLRHLLPLEPQVAFHRHQAAGHADFGRRRTMRRAPLVAPARRSASGPQPKK